MTGQIDNTYELLLHGWEIHPTVIIGCVGLLAWYFAFPVRRARRARLFVLGVVVLALSLVSPLDPLGDQYLFSAHMLQHLLLILAVPPLLILGITPERLQAWQRRTHFAAVEGALGKPSVAWVSNMAMMAIWHIPALYNAANAATGIHVFEHLTFLVTGCMFWWPVLTPAKTKRLKAGPATIYLFGAVIVSTLLGIIITFLPVGHYQPYLHPEDELGALHLVREVWCISAPEDEKLAGLLMWVPGCAVYFAAILWELSGWYRTPDADKALLLGAMRSTQTEVRRG